MNGRHYFGVKAAKKLSLSIVIVTAVTLLIFLMMPPASQAQTPVPNATRDRLAAPPTVPSPTQADEGAQLYWLHCQPCHGDVGQGLSDAPDDDWRAQYPPDHQYCWNSGCHGERPYEEGFTLPRQVPPVIGEGSLNRFGTLAEMHQFMSAAMPFQVPGDLTEGEYLQITAFLAQENGIEYENGLTVGELATIPLHATYNEISVTPPSADLLVNDVAGGESMLFSPFWLPLLTGFVIMIGLIFGGLLWHRHGR